jgi:hypothetical protein
MDGLRALQHLQNKPTDAQKELMNVFLGHWQPWDSLRWIHQSGRKKPSVEDDVASRILAYSRKKLASDPHDKVYALYGILEKLGAELELPDPDYRKPFDVTYQDVTAAVMRFDNSLSLLKQACTSTIPCSWTPDFRDTEINSFPPGTFNASGDQKTYFFRFKASPVLYISGFDFDGIIVECTSSLSALPSSNLLDIVEAGRQQVHNSSTMIESMQHYLRIIQELRQWVRKGICSPQCRKILESENSQSATGTTLDLLYKRDHDALRELALAWEFGVETRLRRVVRQWQSYLLTGTWIDNAFRVGATSAELDSKANESFKEVAQLNITEAMTSSLDWKILSAIYSDARVRFIHEAMCAKFVGKVMFSTRNGYIGFAKETIAVGDRAVLFSGLDVPIVLRESETEEMYRLVSPAYVHRGMHGELVPKNKTRGQMWAVV